MRTTIRLDPHLLAEAKKLAAASGRTVTAVIEEALREVVARRRRRPGAKRPRLTTVGGRGVQPGVDLDDTSALLDLMDSSRGPA
ncbi:MAG TPA: type II toxin-antitoxin system VapB family antitoxin [Vicinamibacterales bacterium]|nr:type II toxin-antitoxin system VapB family antitoxin [Vicinamibacterales bacterium]